MSKGHKNRKPQPASASAPAKGAATVSVATTSVSVPTRHRMGLRFAALLGLSVALGFSFNAANPIGVRFGKVPGSSERSSGGLTNLNLISTASAAAATAPRPIAQTTPATPQPAPPTLPPVPAQETHVQTPTSAPASLSSLSNPPATVVSAPTQTNLNPAPLHWREAKQLVASGQALLVDVRLASAYDAGHIPEAISLPESSSDEAIGAFLKQVPANLTLIVYCSSTSCSQSKRMADRLVGMHQWGSVKYMTGGYQEYQQEELARSQPQQ